MKAHDSITWVEMRTLFAEVNAIRKNLGIYPYKHSHALAHQLMRWNIQPQHKEKARKWFYPLETVLDASYKQCTKRTNLCRACTAISVKLSHLEATPDILADPNYLPLCQAAKAAGIKKSRIGQWVHSMRIIPYYDSKKNRLLYPVDKLRKHGEYRTMQFLYRHFSIEKVKEIKATRKSIKWSIGCGTVSMYHVPELSHL